MAETTELTQDNQVNFADTIKEQSLTIKTLADQMMKPSGQQAPIYNTTPQKTAEKKPPNYTVMILIGVLVYMMFFRKRGR